MDDTERKGRPHRPKINMRGTTAATRMELAA
jgi:hypothetical protein